MGEERAFIEFFSKEKKGAGNAAAESEGNIHTNIFSWLE